MKNTDLRRFAPLGLVLSAVATLVFAGILVMKGLAATGIYAIPDTNILDQVLWISLGVVILGLALTALLDPDRARRFFVGRQLQYGSNSVIMLLAFIGILLFVNMMVYQYSSTLLTPWDFTANKENTLAPETLDILQKLPEPVVARAYYLSQTPRDDIQQLLENFEQNSGGKLTYEFIDPNLDPFRAQADGVVRDATVVLEMAGRKEILSFISEQELDTTILKLMNPTQHKIYFLTGHGERDTQNASETSMVEIKGVLHNKNYITELLNLSNQRAVPDDAKVIIIAGPQVPLPAEEVALLEAYLNKGGALIVMEDPVLFTKFGNAPDPLADMIAKWGITLQNDVIIDTNANNAVNAVANTESYSTFHPITQKMLGFTLVFNTARSLGIALQAPENVTITPLAQTYLSGVAGVWGETDFESIEARTPTFDEKSDNQPPLTLFASAENTFTNGRLVVFGDSDFATDAYQQNFGDILVNAVDWSTHQENLMTLTPKDQVERTFVVPTGWTTIAVILVSICIIPLMILGMAVAAWYSRRRKG